jgi:hypothetical protein
MDTVSLTNVYNILSRIIFGSLIAFPLSLSNYNLSHQEGLSLKYSKTAPPLAIFDDEKISPLLDDADFNSAPQKIHLQSNRLQTRKMVTKIARRFEYLQKVSLQTVTPKIAARTLSGISLQKESQNVVMIKKSIVTPPREIQANVIRKVPTAIVPISPEVAVPREANSFAVNANPRLRERIEEIENLDEVLQEDYSTDTFETRANEVLAQAGVDPKAPSDREIANTYGTGFGNSRRTYTQRMQDVANRGSDDISQRFARSSYFKPRDNPPQRPERPKDPEMNPELPDHTNDKSADNKGKSSEKGTGEGTTVASRSAMRQAMISGPLEMTKGLALTGNQKIIVYRQIGGTRYGEGQVFLNEGRYEIFVEEPNTGVVIAELLENDAMIGRAEILMPEVMLNAKSPEDLKKVPIKIEPIVDQVVAENISAYSYLKKEKIKNSQIKISDAINANTKIFNSSIVVKAMKENHWGNIILGSSKQIFTNILSPDATIQALKEILGVTTPKEQMGIIKGEVLIMGQQVSGAQVEIVGIGNEVFKPTYFNSFLPDQNLNETSANGQYAFVGLPPGSYLVRAKYKGKYLSPQVAPVEAGFVTQIHFDVQKPNLAEAFVFDIQNSEMMSANINFLGSEQKVPVQSRKLISFSGSDGIQFLEVQAQNENYFATRMTVDKSEKEILVPMISQSWLNDLLSRLRVNSIPDTGLIIGTALELPYSVELDPNAYNEDTKIVYFDSQGKPVQGAIATPSGGGFVAINVNQGIRSLFNKYQGTKNLKITTMVVDASAINVFNSKF